MNRIPDKIGKYRVVGEIARGGMGAIYKAEHPTLDRFVVIKKLMLSGQASVRERFRREASIMMDFRNEYIVDVYDHFREGASNFIVQEYVDGLSLEGLLGRERYFPERIALMIFRDACRALKYAHDHGVIHRDIKPGNLLISKRGEVKLVDFGIARTENESQDVLTREGMTLGTPSYMAPEQFRSTRNVDKRADIYSLGVILYESVTGKRPFPGSITPETIRLIQTGRYKSPKRINPALTDFTARLIRKTMHASLAHRYKDLGPIIKKLDRRLASIGVRDEKSELAAYMAGAWIPPRAARHSVSSTLAIVGAAALATCACAFFAYRAGWQYEYLRPSEYGALSVTARVPKGPRQADNIFVSADLFTDDGKEIPIYPDARFSFHRDLAQETDEIAVYVCDTVYAPIGNYRLKAQVDGRLFWSNFYLDSRLEQRLDPTRRKGKVVRISAERSAPLPLEVTLRAVSAADGLPVVAGSKIQVMYQGAWAPLDGEAGKSLMSGGVQKFRVEREGYYTALFSLMVYPFQSQLRIDCELVPYPATLRLDAELEGVSVLLDGLASYRSWGPKPVNRAMPRPGREAEELLISPGKHTLTAIYGNARTEMSFKIESSDRIAFTIGFDPDSREPRLRQIARASK